MKRMIILMTFVCFPALAFVGCTEKSTVTSETKMKTPGGETVIKSEKEVKKTGDHKTGTTP